MCRPNAAVLTMARLRGRCGEVKDDASKETATLMSQLVEASDRSVGTRVSKVHRGQDVMYS